MDDHQSSSRSTPQTDEPTPSIWLRRRRRLILTWGCNVFLTMAAYTIAGGLKGQDQLGRVIWLLTSVIYLYSWCDLTATCFSDICRGDWRRWGGDGCLNGMLVWPFLGWTYFSLSAILWIQVVDSLQPFIPL